MPSSWTACFCWYGLYPSRRSAAAESSFSPPSWLGTSLRHVGKSYFPHLYAQDVRTWNIDKQTSLLSLFILFYFSAAASLWLSFIVLKSDAKLNSSVKLIAAGELHSSPIYGIQFPALFSTCCYLSTDGFFSLLFADSAHLLHTRLPLCYGQLFFQP